MPSKMIVAGAVASLIGLGTAFAQTGTEPRSATGTVDTPTTNRPATNSQRTTTMTPNQGNERDQAAASGNNNQAVATSSANAREPAKGANSFTEGQAKSRLEKTGYQNVNDLKKDDEGVWRGKAEKNGAAADVWVDYKGNVGSSAASQTTTR